MSKTFFNSIICIIAVLCLTVSIANAQDFTDGDIVHMEDSGTLTDANLVEVGNTSSSTTLNLFFRVSIDASVQADTKIEATALVPTGGTAPIPTFSYKDGQQQWKDLQTTTNEDTVSIAYSVLEGIATAQGTTDVQVRANFTTVPSTRFQLELNTTTLDRVYFDCQPGAVSRAVYDVTNDGKIDALDIQAVAVAMINNSLTGDVSEDGNINYVDFDLVTFAVRLGFSLPPPTTNRAPTKVGTIPNQTVNVGATATVDVSAYFTDPDGDTLTYTASSSDTAKATVSVSSATLTLTGVAVGTATITVTATDPDSLSVNQTFTATVVQPNRAPTTVGTIPNQTVNVGEDVTVDVSSYFSDPDGDPLSYAFDFSDPSKVNASTTGSTVLLTGVAAGTLTVTVTATDTGNLTATQTFTVTVVQSNRAPTAVGSIPDQTVNVGGTATVDVSSYFTDADGDTLVYTASSSDTAKATVSVSSATITLTGVAVGTATITVTATDPDSLSVNQTFTATVVQPNRAPTTVGTIPNQTVNVGADVTVDVSSYFSDPDGDPLRYTFDFSDPSKVNASATGSTVLLTGVAAGTLTVTVTATDTGNLTATQTFTVTVVQSNRAPTAVGSIPDQTVGATTVTVDVSTYFSDPDGDTLSYAAVSSDTTKVTVSVSNATVSITRAALSATGTATITVTATDPGGLSATQTFTANVGQIYSPPVAEGTIPNQTLTVGGPAGTVDVTNYFSDAGNNILTYTAVSSDTSKVTVSVSNATVTLTPVAVGTSTITVTATNPNNLSATQTFTVTVVPPNRAPQPTDSDIPDQTVNVGATATVDVSNHFSDPDGDTLTYTAASSDTAKATVSVSSATVTTTGVAAGTATITVTATDPGGLSANKTFTVTVVQPNRAPVAVGTIADRTSSPGWTITFNVSSNFRDPDGDTLTYTASSADTTIATVSISAAEVSLKMIAAGTATITITATDPGGLTATQTFSAIVVQPNRAPVAVGTIPNQTVTLSGTSGGTPVTVDVSGYFSDPDGDTLTYTAASSDTTKATVSVSSATITLTGVAAGTATITVTATDPSGLSVNQTFTVTVVQPNRTPVVSATMPDLTLNVGETTDSIDASNYFSDPDGDGLFMSGLLISDGTVVTTHSVTNPSTFRLTGAAVGNTTITVSVIDPDGLSATQNFTVTVVLANSTPTITNTIPDIQIWNSFTYDVYAHDYFSDPDGDALTYTATTTDSSIAQVGVGGVGNSTVSILANALGTVTITITVTDTGGATASQSFTATVVQWPPTTVGTIPDQTVIVGGTATIDDVSSYFRAPDNKPLTYTAASSDTTKATVSVSNAGVTVTGVAGGTATITVTATEPAGLSADQTFTVTVLTNRAPVITDAIPDVSIENSRVYGIYAHDHFSDPDGDALTYTATTTDSAIASVTIGGPGNSTVSILANALGTVTITITVTDPSGATASQAFSATVVQSNRKPTPVGTISDITMGLGTTARQLEVSSYFRDPDGDTLTYTASSANTAYATVSVSDSTLTIANVSVGAAAITVTAKDPKGTSATQTFTVTVRANTAPRRTGGLPDYSIRVPNSVSFDLNTIFTDDDGDPLTYRVTSETKPWGTATISGSTLTATTERTGAVPSAETGRWDISVAANDGVADATNNDYRVWRITVWQRGSTQWNIPNAAPQTVGTISAKTININQQITLDTSTYFSEADGDVMMYAASSDTTTVATASISGTTVTVTGVALGSATITVVADDGQNTRANQTFTVTVANTNNNAPTASGTIPAQTVNVGSTGTVDVSSYFSDADGDALTYTASSSSTGTATVSVSNATVTITAVAAGTATITVTATDTSGLTATQTISVTVPTPNSAPTTVGTIPNQTVEVGGTGTVDVSGYFSDPNSDTLIYTVSSSSTGTATVSVSGATVTITGVTAATSGVTISVTATDPGGLSATQTFTVSVKLQNRAPTVSNQIPDITFDPGIDVVMFPLTNFSDADGDILTYTASSSDTSLVTLRRDGTRLYLTPVAAGTATITITVSDPGGLTATQTFTATVPVPNSAPTTVGTIPAQTVNVGGTATVDVSSYFSDADGDTLTYTAVSSATATATVSVSNATVTITGVAGGTATITVTATDPGGLSATQTISLTVNSAPATVGTIPAQTVNLGSTATVDVSSYFSDADGDTLTYTAVSSATATATVSVSNATVTITAVAAGTATVTVTATDPGGLSATQTISVTVANPADVNSDGVVNIYDLVLVASQFGTSNSAADVNGDGTVNTQDLVRVSSALGSAPTANQSAAAVANNWLKLARQNASNVDKTAIPAGFSYERGIQVLEELARALTPNATALLANYPNPFNPETWIPYQLAKAADVTVTIYASDGNIVRTLAIGHRDAGMYHNRSQAAYWDGKNEMSESVASGIYFYTLTAGNFSATRKMLILK